MEGLDDDGPAAGVRPSFEGYVHSRCDLLARGREDEALGDANEVDKRHR